MMADRSNPASRQAGYAEIKSRIRQLKKLEARIRFGNLDPSRKPAGAELEWDAFFNLSKEGAGKARYSLERLAALSREDYRKVLDEFFYAVYYRFYQENGIVPPGLYDADILAQLGLAPDAGGSAARFIELMGNYRMLIRKGK